MVMKTVSSTQGCNNNYIRREESFCDWRTHKTGSSHGQEPTIERTDVRFQYHEHKDKENRKYGVDSVTLSHNNIFDSFQNR